MHKGEPEERERERERREESKTFTSLSSIFHLLLSLFPPCSVVDLTLQFGFRRSAFYCYTNRTRDGEKGKRQRL
jgi:hypothetical protein